MHRRRAAASATPGCATSFPLLLASAGMAAFCMLFGLWGLPQLSFLDGILIPYYYYSMATAALPRPRVLLWLLGILLSFISPPFHGGVDLTEVWSRTCQLNQRCACLPVHWWCGRQLPFLAHSCLACCCWWLLSLRGSPRCVACSSGTWGLPRRYRWLATFW